MKRCPFCAEEIQDAAVKCRHCGEMLNAPSTGATGAVGHGQPQGGQSPARPIYGGSPSWKAFFTRYVGGGFAVALGLALAIGGGVSTMIPVVIVGALFLLVGIGIIASTEVSRRATLYRVSTRRIDIESGVLSKRIESMELWRVRDIQFKQSFGQRLLGIGSVHLLTHDATTPELYLQGLTNARQVFEEIKSGIELSRQARNVVGVVE